MLQGGQLAPEAVLALEVELGHRHPFAVRDLGEDAAPRVDDQGLAVGSPPAPMEIGRASCRERV